MRHLAGVGSMLQEWHEWSGYAYHVRRLLTEEEKLPIGCVLDLRYSKEGHERLKAIIPQLPSPAQAIARREMLSIAQA